MGSGGGIAGANSDTLSSSSSLPQGGEGTSKSISLEGGLESELELGCRRNTIPGETFTQEKSYSAVRALISSCLLMMTLTKRDDMLPGKQGCFERKVFQDKIGRRDLSSLRTPQTHVLPLYFVSSSFFLSPPSYANKIYAHVLCDAYVGSRGGGGGGQGQFCPTMYNCGNVCRRTNSQKRRRFWHKRFFLKKTCCSFSVALDTLVSSFGPGHKF